jgi:hypothetical protein
MDSEKALGIRPQNSLLNEVVMADDGGEPDEFLYKVLVVGEVRLRRSTLGGC